MKVFKSINASGQVSYHNSVRKAVKSLPAVIYEMRGLIVKR